MFGPTAAVGCPRDYYSALLCLLENSRSLGSLLRLLMRGWGMEREDWRWASSAGSSGMEDSSCD
jgi:hypothetical protein